MRKKTMLEKNITRRYVVDYTSQKVETINIYEDGSVMVWHLIGHELSGVFKTYDEAQSALNKVLRKPSKRWEG